MIDPELYARVFKAAPIGEYLLTPSSDPVILSVNDEFLSVTGLSREDLVGRRLFDAFPPAPDEQQESGAAALRHSLTRVVETRKRHALPVQRYPIRYVSEEGRESFEVRFWSAINVPVFDDDGQMLCIAHSTMDVTELVTGRPVDKPDDPARVPSESGLLTRTLTMQQVNRALEAERERLRHLFDRAPGFVYFTHGPEHVIDQANEALYELVGNRDITGKPVRDAFPDIRGQGFFEMHDKVFRSGQPWVGNALRILLTRPGESEAHEHFVDLTCQPILDAEGKVVGICGQGQDITGKKRMEDELRTNDERWKLALEASGGGMWDWNLQTDEVLHSDSWYQMLGYTVSQLDRGIKVLQDLMHPEDRARAQAALNAHLSGQTRIYSSEFRLKTGSGGWLWILSRGAVVKWDDQHRPLRVVGTNTDISHAKDSEQQIWRQANFDPLTGLPNRRLFRDRLEQEVKHAHRDGKSMALLFLDLDRFKEVNDLHGHDAGDVLLAEAARRILGCVREIDTVARIGGDEFTVILTGLQDVDIIEQIAQQILDTLTLPFAVGREIGQDVGHVSGSVGITLYPHDALTPEELIRKADMAMYAAKQAGKNQFRYFTAEMGRRAHHRLRLINALRAALHGDEMSVAYQPIVELATNRIVKAEALARWQNPRLGRVDPAEFIPLAEESGIIHELGDWIFQEAAHCARSWSKTLGEPFQVGVNKSPVQFMAKGDDGWVEYLERLGLPAQCLSVEITEGLLLHASGNVESCLLRYRDAGVQVALDDFGTGYSSMAYLKKFDIDYLKIDQSFVRDMTVDAQNRTIAESIIVMAHRLGLKVVAEGVETAAQRDLLAAAGCDYAQGYLFSPPVTPAEFERLLLDSRARASPLH